MSTEELTLVPPDVRRVRRTPADAQRWYHRLSRWYDTAVDPFEADARRAGVDLFDPGPGDFVLDVGCGTGTALVALDARVSPNGRVYGVDIAKGMCARAAEKAAAASLERTAVLMGDGARLPFPHGAFDGVFASFVLELFDTPRLPDVLAEWHRVLQPRGTLGVVSLSRRDVGPMVRAYEWFHDRYPRVADCRPIYVAETIETNGFEVEERRERSIAGLPVDIVRAVPR